MFKTYLESTIQKVLEQGYMLCFSKYNIIYIFLENAKGKESSILYDVKLQETIMIQYLGASKASCV